MTDIVINAEGLGKRYLIGHQSAERERYTTLRDLMARSLKGLGRSARDMMRGRQIIIGDEVEEFWALNDVSFEIRRGEVVGIVGRNGAGKSTLLKVLSRITEPSEGRVEIRGRIASLLEVGTGFHPELTGRENIYLNGAILGMTRAEIRKKFDEIVAFAEVEKFLDTPVKRYSSGMYVRLAFSVAAHLEPEILVVDEVLAVGDAEFQKKCLGKMQDVAGHGRTVLFVSHNMAAVQNLCDRAILLRNGRKEFDGDTTEAIKIYTSTTRNEVSNEKVDLTDAPRTGGKIALISSISFPDGPPHLQVFQELKLVFYVESCEERFPSDLSVWFTLKHNNGEHVHISMQKDCNSRIRITAKSKITATSPIMIHPGKYTLSCGLLMHGREIVDWVEDAATIEVANVFEGGGAFDNRLGYSTLLSKWLVESNTESR